MLLRNSLLDRLKVVQPCSEPWDQMSGDDRARFCEHCQKTVFNIAGMTRSEAERLIRSQEGSLCARVSRMPDGRVRTAPDPRSLGSRLNRWLAAFAFTTVTAWAESQRGIRVNVTDASTAAIPDARVRLFQEGSSISRTAATNSSGEAWFPDVPNGTYTVEVAARGFVIDRSKPITVADSSTVSHTAQLRDHGALTGVVIVTDYRRPLLQRLFPFAFRRR